MNRKQFISMAFILILLVGLMAGNVSAKKDNIDLNFQSVKLKDAFRALADVANMNIVTDSSVTGSTTIHLEDISFREAVDLLAKTSGLDYRIVNNTILVATPDKLQAGFGRKVTKVFKLENSDPEAIKESVNLLVNKDSIRVDKRTSSLIVTTYQSKLPKVKSTIKQLDEEKKQVIIQARIEEISHNGLEKMGINWDFGSLSLQKNNTTSSSGSSDSSSSNSDEGSSAASLLEIGNVSLSYQSMLDLLEKNGHANVLANPQITTVDGKEANIDIGESVPILQESSDGEPTVSFKDVGISLDIKPRITKSDQVYISVKPEVSVVSEYFETTSGARYPVIDTRKAETNVRVSSGETIAIGGLIKEEEYENLSKVPLLGDVPLLGKLFRNKSIDRKKVELVIFLTPKVVSQNPNTTKTNANKEINSFTYKVSNGDTMWSIGNLFDISFAEILEHNDIKYVTDLKAGQTLKIPTNDSSYYKVKKDDTLVKVAEKFDISVSRIKKINNIQSLDNKTGTKIYLPVKVK